MQRLWQQTTICAAVWRFSTVPVGTLITERPRTDPYVRVYAYGSYEG
jgi:hypothetical protein